MSEINADIILVDDRAENDSMEKIANELFSVAGGAEIDIWKTRDYHFPKEFDAMFEIANCAVYGCFHVFSIIPNSQENFAYGFPILILKYGDPKKIRKNVLIKGEKNVTYFISHFFELSFVRKFYKR